MASSSKTQIKQCLNVIGKVRVVARIRGFSNQEMASDATHSSCIISVRKSEASEKVTLSFDDQISSRKNEYEVNQCYGQNEDTALLFSKEVKPQIPRVFNGEHSTFIAFGARGSGKTHTVQGSEENMGLGMLVMDEILKIVEGGRHTVAVSIYEVFQNHVYDLLDSKHPEVHILEDAQGKTILKGLSKVPVKSMLEFQKLYCNGMILNKPSQKLTLELPRRSHKALTIHILACDEGTNPICVGKMNFVDLTGYENPRRNSIDGTNFVESTQVNKSLNALLNVIHAINANESRVPYRESKLARVLQDSLGGNNHISILVFLNPLYCPDTIHAVTLASRLKDIKPMVVFSSAKKHSHSRVPASANKASSGVGVGSTTKKLTNSRLPLSAKKTNVLLKGRNLFGGTKQANIIKEQVSNMANNPSNHIVKPDTLSGDSAGVPYVKEERCISDGALFSSDVKDVPSAVLTCSPEEKAIESGANPEMLSLVIQKEDASVNTQSNCTECIPHINGDNVEKENSFLSNEGQAPLSFGLEKILNDLNRLQSLESMYHLQGLGPPTPLCVNRPSSPIKDLQQENDEYVLLHPLKEVDNCVDTLEPKTPMVTHKMDLSNCRSGTFSKRSSGMKQSLVRDYLQFLNSASKDELKGIRGIGEKRATYILELREESPEPFKSLDDLQEIGLSAKQVKSMMKNVAGDIFS